MSRGIDLASSADFLNCGHTIVHLAKKIGFLVAGALLLLLSACDGDTDTAEAVLQQDAPATVVVLNTSMGDIEIALDEENAPITVANFLAYLDSGYYERTIFHRVIPNFMIQGGGFTEANSPKPTFDPIVNEAANSLNNVKYSIAMARRDEIDSATSQFFINVADNEFLDHGFVDRNGEVQFGYAVFGNVVAGFDVVDAIAVVPTRITGISEADPVVQIAIQSIARK